jgi:hypothetical protein
MPVLLEREKRVIEKTEYWTITCDNSNCRQNGESACATKEETIERCRAAGWFISKNAKVFACKRCAFALRTFLAGEPEQMSDDDGQLRTDGPLVVNMLPHIDDE